jgi:hypothetical protein
MLVSATCIQAGRLQEKPPSGMQAVAAIITYMRLPMSPAAALFGLIIVKLQG